MLAQGDGAETGDPSDSRGSDEPQSFPVGEEEGKSVLGRLRGICP